MNRKIDWAFASVCALIWLVLFLVFAGLGVRLSAFGLFTIFLVITVFIPGYQSLSALRLKLTAFAHFSLSWIVGYPLTTLVYFLCRYFQLEGGYAVFLGGFFCWFSFFTAKNFATPKFHWQRHGYFHPLLLSLYLIIIGVCALATFSNGLILADNSFQMATMHPQDSLYHVSLVYELSNSFPPRIPFAASYPLIYHYFSDLFAALANRWAHLDIWDLLNRFLPVYYFSTLFLSVALLSKELVKKRSTVLLALILVILGSNLAFFTNLLGFYEPKNCPTLEFQFVPTFSVLHVNPIINALTLFLAGCFALSQYQSNREISWLVLVTFLFTSTAFYKIFLAALIGGGLAIVALLDWLKTRRLAGALLLIIAPIMLLTIFMVSISPVRQDSSLKFKPALLSMGTLACSGLFKNANVGYDLLRDGDFPTVIKLGLLGGVFWFLGSFGLRVMGVYFTKDYLFTFGKDWTHSLLSWMCILGIFLSLFFALPPEETNINQFFMFSLYLAALLTALFSETISAVKPRLLVAGLTIIFTVSTSFAMLARRPTGYFPAPYTQAVRFLQENTASTDIIAVPQRDYLGVILSLSGRRTMYINCYKVQNLIGLAAARRLEIDNQMLYQAQTPQQAQEIIQRYQINYVIEDAQGKTSLPESHLKTVYATAGFVIKKVVVY